MVVHLKLETESRLQELAATTGRAPDDLVEDAMSSYLADLTEVRNKLDGRYDDIKSGGVQAADGQDALPTPVKLAKNARRMAAPVRAEC
jgi:predicted DNA-binding protein